MKPSESELPAGVKPLSSYAHGTLYVSDENRISRKTRPKTHRTISDSRAGIGGKYKRTRQF